MPETSDPAEQLLHRLQRRLLSILQRANALKQSTGIEPQVPSTGLIADIDAIAEEFADDETANIKYSALESAAKRVFYKLVQTSSIEDAEFGRVWNLLDIGILCAERNQCEQVLPFYLIEELIETQTTDACRLIFDYLESRREKLLQKDFSKTQLVVLRFCNDLLRRLSRAKDAEFCGRVFFFLFQSFPLGDLSSVNLRGEFHADNVTHFDTRRTDRSDCNAMELDKDKIQRSPGQTSLIGKADARGESSEQSENPGSDVEFYATFWQLQQYFSAPTNLFGDAQFLAFQQGFDQTLAKFISTPVVVQMKMVGDESRGTKRKLGADAFSVESTTVSAKYLTSQDLFELELSDLAFQRHILVQALILIDFLLSLTEKAKRKLAEANLAVTNKAVVYNYVLDDEKRKWAQKTRGQIAEYLQDGPDGNFYYRMVNTVLSRDKRWARWKIERCPPIIADAVPCAETIEAKAAVNQATLTRRNKSKSTGAIDLTFLSEGNQTSRLERLKDPARCTPPSVTKLADDLSRDKLDRDFATGEELAVLDAAMDRKSWQIVRELARHKLNRLDKLESTQALEGFLKTEEVTT